MAGKLNLRGSARGRYRTKGGVAGDLVMTRFLYRTGLINRLGKWNWLRRTSSAIEPKRLQNWLHFCLILRKPRTRLNQNLKIEHSKQPKYHRKRLNQWMHCWQPAYAGRIVPSFFSPYVCCLPPV